MARIGYARVSTREQNPDHQIDALNEAGCERVFIDKVSGKLAKRPALTDCFNYIRSGDQMVITRLSRLGRSLKDLLDIVDKLKQRDVGLIVTMQGLDTTTSHGRLVFNVLASVDEFTRELIVEGTLDGLAAARARGRKGGRRPKMTAQKLVVAREMYDSKKHTMQAIADTVGVSRATLYRHLEESSDG